MKFLLILATLFFFSCSTGDPPPGVTWPTSARGVYTEGNQLLLDTSVILLNENLDRFIRLLETHQLKQEKQFSTVPLLVRNFLRSLTPDSFCISDNRKAWGKFPPAADDLVCRELKYLEQSPSLVVLSYYKGNRAGHVLLIEHSEKQILDFWAGSGRNLMDKDSILKCLKTKGAFGPNILDL